MEPMLEAQSVHEKRFNCIVCMEAKLEMVYGICQHRLCSSCLYLDNGALKSGMDKCPVCAKQSAFPQTQPDVLEDNIEIQKYLGVRECPNKEQGCKFQLWDWEMEDHVSVCQFAKPSSPCQQQRLNSSIKSTAKFSKQQVKRKNMCSDKFIQQVATSQRKSARILHRISQRQLKPRH